MEYNWVALVKIYQPSGQREPLSKMLLKVLLVLHLLWM
nr:MAG TPA: hypothetical protein [Crassvirales sp.]